MEIAELIQIGGNIGSFGWIVIVLFFLYDKGIIRFGKNGNGFAPTNGDKISSNGEKIPGWAQQLIQYYNHNATERDDKIVEKLDEVLRAQQEHNQLERENNTKINEMLRYGVPCREKP